MTLRACAKAAIDCTGYRKEMDNTVDLIIADYYKPEAVESFRCLQEAQERMWLEWRDEIGLNRKSFKKSE